MKEFVIFYEEEYYTASISIYGNTLKIIGPGKVSIDSVLIEFNAGDIIDSIEHREGESIEVIYNKGDKINA